MYFMSSIISACNSASSFFYSIYLEVYSWVYPFWLAAAYFSSLSSLFSNLAWYFYDFNTWVDNTANKLLEILNWNTIQSYIRSWFYSLSDLSTIFYFFWTNVTNVISNWWSTAQATVKSWDDAVKSFLQAQLNTVNSLLTSLQASWDGFKGKIPSIDAIISWFTNWWGNVLAQVIAWGALTALQIQSLVDSAFTLRNGFWEGWQDIRAQVLEFFADPLQWLYDRMDEWFERFW